MAYPTDARATASKKGRARRSIQRGAERERENKKGELLAASLDGKERDMSTYQYSTCSVRQHGANVHGSGGTELRCGGERIEEKVASKIVIVCKQQK